ncbi:MAG TPA: DUF6502 family protein [Burkholderiaceae bacterium]|nr:DUF6502 family protein [Burkholderiaceae bacterium]
MARKNTSTPTEPTDTALADALELLLSPVARLCLARGLTFATAVELLKQSYVGAAREAHAGRHGARDIARVSATTGISRREVTRISNELVAPSVVRGSPATKVFTRWASSTKLRDRNGRPKPLRRHGHAPSFEALSYSVTHDIHPTVILDELCRLGLTRYDTESGLVHLLRDAFAPHEDQGRALSFLGSNVGDHLAAAVDNVLADKPPHLEQAIFADELSTQSVTQIHSLVGVLWRSMLSEFVPKLEALIEADRAAGKRARQRVRIGLYSFHTDMPDDIEPSEKD